HALRGLPAPVILDGQARLGMLQKALDGHTFPAYGSRTDDFERQLLTFIDRAKDEMLGVDGAYQLAEVRQSAQYHDLARGFDLYQRRLQRSHRLFDWGELQTRLIAMFEDQSVLDRWRGKFKYILVDEFQDVNEA